MIVKDFTTGSCLCKSISFEIEGAISKVFFCHCKQCRMWNGHYTAAVGIEENQLSFSRSENLKWFSSSVKAERGFCGDCGSCLFWKENGSSVIFVWAGTISDQANLKPGAHMYTKFSGSYYQIPEDCEHFFGDLPD